MSTTFVVTQPNHYFLFLPLYLTSLFLSNQVIPSLHLIHDQHQSSEEPINAKTSNKTLYNPDVFWCQTVKRLSDTNISVKAVAWAAANCCVILWRCMKKKSTRAEILHRRGGEVNLLHACRDWNKSRETLMHLKPRFRVYGAADMRGDNHPFYMHHRYVRYSHTHACCFWNQLKATLHLCIRARTFKFNTVWEGYFKRTLNNKIYAQDHWDTSVTSHTQAAVSLIFTLFASSLNFRDIIYIIIHHKHQASNLGMCGNVWVGRLMCI